MVYPHPISWMNAYILNTHPFVSMKNVIALLISSFAISLIVIPYCMLSFPFFASTCFGFAPLQGRN
jgi:hypothetical protein